VRHTQVVGERACSRAFTGVLFFMALWLGAAVPTAAQSVRRPPATADSARHTADLFFRAIADERWDAAAAFIDSSVIRRLVAEQVRQPPRTSRREMTIEDFMRDDPDKPLAVAEYELKRFQKNSARFDEGEMLSYEFLGIGSIAALRALTTQQATVAYLKARDFRAMMREQMRRSGCDTTAGTMPPSFRRIVGSALSSDTVAYVLYEDAMFAMPSRNGVLTEPSVMILRLRGSAWKIVPSTGRMGGPVMGFGAMRCDSTQRRPR
jgi:hypothetical protein